ncbi:uncharacterized protein LOC143019337 [Oratosquilla oratoria]|uniref:uncharacterized protein LOC143019337 n=1 Tax=Oratosquilla oratoria TaxID=337810 RepID=UPI003F777BA5
MAPCKRRAQLFFQKLWWLFGIGLSICMMIQVKKMEKENDRVKEEWEDTGGRKIAVPLNTGMVQYQWMEPTENDLTVSNVTNIIESIADFHRILGTPEIRCRRLVRFGGIPECGKLDGHKLICLDEAFEVLPKGRNVSNACLTFSFGVHSDTTFDDAVSIIPCTVHMFDILELQPMLEDNMFFHTNISLR